MTPVADAPGSEVISTAETLAVLPTAPAEALSTATGDAAIVVEERGTKPLRLDALVEAKVGLGPEDVPGVDSEGELIPLFTGPCLPRPDEEEPFSSTAGSLSMPTLPGVAAGTLLRSSLLEAEVDVVDGPSEERRDETDAALVAAAASVAPAAGPPAASLAEETGVVLVGTRGEATWGGDTDGGALASADDAAEPASTGEGGDIANVTPSLAAVAPAEQTLPPLGATQSAGATPIAASCTASRADAAVATNTDCSGAGRQSSERFTVGLQSGASA